MPRKLLTLTDIARLSGISMPTLLRYKKNYQDRIPSVGTGRTQRYPKKAVRVFQQIKDENLAARGRTAASNRSVKSRRKAASPRRAKKARRKAARKTATRGRKKTAARTRKKSAVRRRAKKVRKKAAGRPRKKVAAKPRVTKARKKAAASARRRGTAKPRRAAKRAARKSTARRSRARVSSPELDRRIAQIERAQQQIDEQLRSLVRALKEPLQITVRT